MFSIGSPTVLLYLKTAILLSKIYLLKKSIASAYAQASQSELSAVHPNTKKLWYWVMLILFCSAFGDFQWIFKLLRKTIFLTLAPNPVLWFIRINWAMSALGYLSLGLLIEKLVNKSFVLTIRHYISIGLCAMIMTYLICIAFFQYNVVDPAARSSEYLMYRGISFYVFFTLLLALFSVLIRAYKSNLPRILKNQSKILVLCLLTPHLLLCALNAIPFIIYAGIEIDNYFFIGLSDLLEVSALYFCARRMLGLRFLNMNSHVQSFDDYNFINDFKTVLEQLGHVTSAPELQHITKVFFERAFTVDAENAQLYIRNLEGVKEDSSSSSQEGFLTLPAIEQFLTMRESRDALSQYLLSTKILIRDEIEFDYFYGENQLQKELIDLLETIDASIFLPLYEQQTIVAYIIIRKNARPKELFSNIERDEMLVFSSYLSTVIYLLRHRNLKALMYQEKELKEELYFKHQEIHHYKESIRTLLKTHTTQKIGVMYHKNKSFTWANQAAKELISQTCPHLAQMQKLALEIKKYGSERKITIHDAHGNQLICAGYTGADKSQVLLLIFYPDIADSFTIPFETLKDLSSWDYAIYLETTKSGQLINQLIPSSTAALLNFKIDLLKIAFSKGPTLVELPDGDVMPIVHILHHISLRSMLHTITLEKAEEQNEVALQLFGMDQVFSHEVRKESLLEKLSDTGTIFIQNIEFLSKNTQEQLLAFLTSGMFQPLKSDRKIASNARIIFSTDNNLGLLAQQGHFSMDLYNKLKKSSLSLPSLLTIPQHELTELAQRLSEQAIKNKELNTLIALNEKETTKILDQRPVSLHEFKERIQNALMNKTAKKKLDHLIEFNPAYLTTDPELTDAIRLGKHALKDRYIMRMLWNKFQNQTKIATLLNVNRSSVNRRCKEFKLISEQEQ